jgi:hypothetical protein
MPGVEVDDANADAEASWGLWTKAVASMEARTRREEAPTAPSPLVPDADAITRPMSLEEKTPEQRKNDALAVIEALHPRVALAVRTIWGFKECVAYLNRLVLEGYDGTGRSRVGFNPEVTSALLRLADLHEAQFGPVQAPQQELGFADSAVRTGLDGVR